jgi:Lrp/AsnC family transcriptional regulator
MQDKMIPLDVVGDFRTSVQIRNVKEGRGLPLNHIDA